MPGLAPMYARERAKHEHARLALEVVLDACRHDGIDVLPVKGVLTARLFYRGLPVDDMLRRARASTAPLGVPHLQPELHDHAVLLCVNAFKDKLIDAMPGAIRDLELLPAQEDFEADRFVALAGESGVSTIAWIVANWLVETGRSVAWRGLRDALARVSTRRRYARLFNCAIASRVPPRSVLRVLARAGADRPGSQVGAVCVMAAEPVVAFISGRRPPNVPTTRRNIIRVEAPEAVGKRMRSPSMNLAR
jgi:hypothetical protein